MNHQILTQIFLTPAEASQCDPKEFFTNQFA